MAGNRKIVNDVINSFGDKIPSIDTLRKAIFNALRRARRDEQVRIIGRKKPDTKGKVVVPIGGANYVCKPVSEVTGKKKRKRKKK